MRRQVRELVCVLGRPGHVGPIHDVNGAAQVDGAPKYRGIGGEVDDLKLASGRITAASIVLSCAASPIEGMLNRCAHGICIVGATGAPGRDDHVNDWHETSAASRAMREMRFMRAKNPNLYIFWQTVMFVVNLGQAAPYITGS